MYLKIRNRIDCEIKKYLGKVYKTYSLNSASPLLFSSIKNFILRKGKRIRPFLFVVGYLGFTKQAAAGLYTSAASIELLHDFFLVHDDIIDKSATRRGKPSMHARFDRYLSNYQNIKFNGQDLAIVAGDIIFALGLHAFLSIKVEQRRKELALTRLIEATLYTGSGEFIELLSGIKNIDAITRNDIYKIYDLKTANYTFAAPLAIGATLAGASKIQINKLISYGTYLGRAFQINDDILGLFGEEKYTGKSNLTDLKEGKKTILIWYAYNHAQGKDKAFIKKILSKRAAGKTDLLKIQKIIIETGALDYAKREISLLLDKAYNLNALSAMRPRYKNILNKFAERMFNT